MKLRNVSELDIKGKRVFLRCDFNVPLDADQAITDDTRIRESLETIRFVLGQETKLILASHLGRPKGAPDPKYSLEPVGARLAELIDHDVLFAHDCVGDGPRKLIEEMRAGDIVLLENTRFHKEETSNDPEFSRGLAAFGDVYVNDAFGTLHRAHASTAGMAEFFKERGVGLLVEKEIENLSRLREKPEHPFVMLLGGAKVADKIGVIEGLMPHVDTFLIGGGMAYTFLKAQGIEVGKSLVETEHIGTAKRLLLKMERAGKQILLPIDHVAAREFNKNALPIPVNSAALPADLMGLDIGPKTVEQYERIIFRAKMTFWNGPMGVFEFEPFKAGTTKVAKAIAYGSGFSVIGGGDSAAAVAQLGMAGSFGHVSTGGGASLEFLEGQALPGLLALAERER